MDKRRFTYLALIALSTFIIGVALITVWIDAREIGIPAVISPDVGRFLLSCPDGECQAICPAKQSEVPTIKPEVQSDAPLEILLEPPATNSSPGGTAIGKLVVRNKSTEPIIAYGLIYQISGSAWSDTSKNGMHPTVATLHLMVNVKRK